MHAPVLVTSLIFWACLGVGAAGFNSFIGSVGSIVMMVLSYLVYIVAVCCCSDMKGYINNLKAFDNYKNTYDTMVEGKGYFSFWI